MNGKKKVVAVAMLSVMLLGVVAIMPVSAWTTYYWINTGEEKVFLLHKGETAEVYYYPHEVGNRNFEAWHTSMYYWDKCAGMSFYWTENYGSQWNWWRNAAVGFYWPKVNQNLYSGSTDVGYKFAFRLHNDPSGAEMLEMHVKIT